ncbi:hypothetical protein SAMN02745163_04092 [Clostridium cavendishii DSM 21758]|uniref:DUF3784 domain-containing protein n=1 Tax=Clostridium cavendishii DSM 21758 TaxID=1121302 RepID=A0A1M6TRZ2_9CLOT|nr:hypothetical protein [Clostridium cavendishii]SHK59608.1 hypothetical protein SAMN02745163_04092 [Clostridium cavendishii DSM 21758]
MNITATTIVLLIPSIFMILLGIMLLLNKSTIEKFKEGTKYSNKQEYVAFNAKFNLIMGFIGLGLVILNIFLSQYKDIIVIAYIVLMFLASILQRILNKKYR